MDIYGVFIGINDFEDPRIKSLKYARNDADFLYTQFTKKFPNQNSNFHFLPNEVATKENIYKLVGEEVPRYAKEKDIVILYFATHGSPETYKGIDDVSRYIITHNTSYDNIFSTAIDMEVDLLRFIKRIRADLTLTILDTCFSGSSGGRTFMGSFLKQQISSFRDTYSLKKLDLGSGKIFFSACGENEVAKEDGALQHGVFTHFLCKHLTNASSTEHQVGIGTLYDKVFGDVKNYTNGKQCPVITGKIAGACLPTINNLGD